MKLNKEEKIISKKIPWKKNLFLFLILTIFTIIYTYYIRDICDDELYNYGFSLNILNGLTPYSDFNMIIPPLFHYIVALFLKIFGTKLLVYHILIALIVSAITMISYQKIGKSALAIYITMLTYPYTGYNIFCLLLLFILITRKEDNYSKIIDPILIIMMVFTKQTLGLLILPSLLYAKNKKKTFLIYFICVLLFLIYLLLNHNLYQFIDYCFLGMLDFTNQNNTGFNPLLLLEIIILMVLICFYRKKKDKNILYVCMFQIITFPIVDYYHFVISFAPVLYLIFLSLKKWDLLCYFALILFGSFFFSYNAGLLMKDQSYQYLEHYTVNNFMKGRVTSRITENYILEVEKYLERYSSYTPFILGNFSYLIKLNLEIPINKYDIINNGNMGYHGALKYQEEIDNYCKENKCIFIINDEEATEKRKNQTNKTLLKYVIKNYNKKFSSTIFSVYTN